MLTTVTTIRTITQQLLLPQGTPQEINRKRTSRRQLNLSPKDGRHLPPCAICPDGFSIDLDKFAGLDPFGHNFGLATKVDNRYFQTFAVAAAASVAGLEGLAQIDNNNISSIPRSGSQRHHVPDQQEEGEQILNHFLNRLPIITLKEGSRARVPISAVTFSSLPTPSTASKPAM